MRRSVSLRKVLTGVAFAMVGVIGLGGLSRYRVTDEFWVGAVGQFEGNEAARENVRGILLATEQVNATGGVRGRPVRLMIKDDEGRGELAARAARAFVADPRVSVVIGPTTSAATIASAPVYNGHLAAIATTASAAALSGLSPWLFRVVLSDSVVGAQLARFAGSRGWRSAAVLYQNDVYGRGLADAFSSNFHGKIVASDPMSSQTFDVALFARYYERVAPDVVFVIAGSGTVPVSLRQALVRRHMHVAIIASEGATDLERNSTGADEIYVSAPFSGFDEHAGLNPFVEAFVARFGHTPKHDAALAYDAAKTAFGALRAVGGDRTAVRARLASLDSTSATIGATGKVYFDSRGDRKAAHGVLFQIKNGHAVVLKDALK